MTIEEMCNSCRHRFYCLVANKKDHWCGNYQSQGGRQK